MFQQFLQSFSSDQMLEAPPSQSRVEGETEQTLLAKSGLQLEDRDHAAQEKGKE